MSKIRKRMFAAIAVIILVAAVVFIAFVLINRQAERKAQEEILPTTEIGKVLAKDLDTKYPETPTEVVKMYWRINNCIYNEGATDKQFEQLLQQLRKMYDEELLASEDNSMENMGEKLKKDVEQRKKAKQTLSVYLVQQNDTVEVQDLNGRDAASVIASILIKAKGEKATKTYEKFLCRRDSKGDWKILGWEQVSQKEAETVGVE